MEKEIKKSVVFLPGMTIYLGNQNLCLSARVVIQINGNGKIPPELMQAIVKAIEES